MRANPFAGAAIAAAMAAFVSGYALAAETPAPNDTATGPAATQQPAPPDANATAQDQGTQAFGPGMMRGYGRGMGGYAHGYGPGMRGGYGPGAGSGYGSGWMHGDGYGPGWPRGYGRGWMHGQGYGPGWMHGQAYGPGWMHGYGPGWMHGQGYGAGWMHGYGPGWMHGYRPWMMEGYGPGMMYGYGPGAMGPWMMGGLAPWCAGAGWRDQGSYHPAALNLSVQDVKNRFERWLQWRDNPHLKLGAVKEAGPDTITVDIVTQDNSLVQQFEVNRKTGWINRAKD